MKNPIVVSLLVLAYAGAAAAGSAGAGPAGTGSSLAGSIVVPRGAQGAGAHAPLPGSTGTVTLTLAQSSAVASYLQSQPDVKVSDTQISAPTTLADGTAGRITLDTRTGALTLTRL